MTSSHFRSVGLLGFCLALSGCAGSISFATRGGDIEQPATACVPADRPFEVSTTAWEHKRRQVFEESARRGPVVVQATGCEWHLLPQCEVDAAYSYRAVPLSRESSERGRAIDVGIGGGVSGRPSTARTSGTSREVVVTGVYEISTAPTPGALRGVCAGATHVVTRYSVGAFRLGSGRDQSGGITLPHGGGFEATTWNVAKVEAGSVESCVQSLPERPPAGCDSSIDLDVIPLSVAGSAPSPAPAMATAPAANAPAPLARVADTCGAADDDRCAMQCRSGSLAACTALATRCAGGSVAACIAASATSFGRLLSANP